MRGFREKRLTSEAIYIYDSLSIVKTVVCKKLLPRARTQST